MVCPNCQKLHEQNVEYAKLVTKNNELISKLRKETIELKEDRDKKNEKIAKLNAQVANQEIRIDDLITRIVEQNKKYKESQDQAKRNTDIKMQEKIAKLEEQIKEEKKRNNNYKNQLASACDDSFKKDVQYLLGDSQEMSEDFQSLQNALYTKKEKDNIEKINPKQFAKLEDDIKHVYDTLININLNISSLCSLVIDSQGMFRGAINKLDTFINHCQDPEYAFQNNINSKNLDTLQNINQQFHAFYNDAAKMVTKTNTLLSDAGDRLKKFSYGMVPDTKTLQEFARKTAQQYNQLYERVEKLYSSLNKKKYAQICNYVETNLLGNTHPININDVLPEF